MGKILDVDHQLKIPVVRRSEYTLYLEQPNVQTTFIHCDIHGKWTASVKRRLQEDWKTLKSLHGGPLFALHDPSDRKHHHFLKIFGFTRLKAFIGPDGELKEVYQT